MEVAQSEKMEVPRVLLALACFVAAFWIAWFVPAIVIPAVLASPDHSTLAAFVTPLYLLPFAGVIGLVACGFLSLIDKVGKPISRTGFIITGGVAGSCAGVLTQFHSLRKMMNIELVEADKDMLLCFLMLLPLLLFGVLKFLPSRRAMSNSQEG